MKERKIELDWPLLGNEHVVNFLAKSIANNRVAGTYIFSGPDDLGKTTIANYFAYSLLCQNQASADKLPCGKCLVCKKNHFDQERSEENISLHADFHLIKREKDKKNISIEQVRDFIRSLEMSSFLNSYKIGIIKHADSLSEEAANALLKTLEEPRNKVVVVLVTSNIEALPATIVSRSQVLNFFPVKTDVIYDYLIQVHGASRSVAKNLSKLCLGRPALAVKFLKDKDFFEQYKKRVDTFVAFSREDYNGRFQLVGELLNEKTSGQEAAKLAYRIIEVWLGLTRDLVLLNYGQTDLVQHEIVLHELEAQKDRINLPLLLKLNENLRQAQEYLRANVNPKAVLENIAMSI